ncbi:MAG: hypothetical protein WC866_00775 [Patescibacteria group bacterium]|jgi:hypothetical protein
MPFQPSTPEELQRSAEQVCELEALIHRLRAEGHDVHIIWDVDRVLVSGRSDDAFAHLGFKVEKYFDHEERLFTEVLENGPFARIARACGEDGMHQSQDIVTARSSFLGLRVTRFLLHNFGIDVNWMLQIGHQSKEDSYRIILEYRKKNPKSYVISVDDMQKHTDAFDAAASKLGMNDRSCSILAHIVREYDEDEMRHEVDAVMAVQGDHPTFVDTFCTQTGRLKRRVMVTPKPRDTMREMFQRVHLETLMRGCVELHRVELEKLADELMPGAPKSIDNLFYLYELIREPR